MNDPDIDPRAKCKDCGHSRWRHQNMEVETPGQTGYKLTDDPIPRHCRADNCYCGQYKPKEYR